MELLVLGLNHRTAPVALRERIAVPKDELTEALRALHGADVIREVMITSTCNRLEVLCVPAGTARHVAVEQLIAGFLATRGETALEELEPVLYRRWGAEAVRHVMRTASSLDSLVIGEPQILGQVKDAFEIACAAGTVGATLQQTVQRVFSVAKRVRTESGIGRSAVSVGSAAAELAGSIFSDLRRSGVALVGAGEMAAQSAAKIQEVGARSVTVLNRSPERAEKLASGRGWAVRPLSELGDVLAEVDVVISSTSARGYVIDVPLVRRALSKRRYRPLFIVDIALPRDVDPAVSELERVYLYNIDDLDAVISRNREQRQAAAERAEALVSEAVERFQADVRGQRVGPIIKEMRGHLLSIADAEIERTMKRLPGLEVKERVAIERMVNAIVNKFLHSPVTMLKAAAKGDDSDRTVDWMIRMFGLDDIDIDSTLKGAASEKRDGGGEGGRRD